MKYRIKLKCHDKDCGFFGGTVTVFQNTKKVDKHCDCCGKPLKLFSCVRNK